MPALEEKVIKDIEQRLIRHLAHLTGYGQPEYITSGGSAAIFKVESKDGPRAFKAFNPAFFEGESAAADRKRLDVQRSTMGHLCPSLVQTYRVEEAEGTAIMEMEYLAWPPLDKCLADVPDDKVIPLITQLVDAVRFLEAQNIVHRDIKPENIHVSPDFAQLKLLDLGVARLMETDEAPDAAGTDHGKARPFLATAQYSSPEYLFRLDEPSPRLWRGLNFYQVGAVLHDLIMKKPIFHHEMQLKNRWLVAKAVLTKRPSFADDRPNRLLPLKALAGRCLVKDLDSRLNLVGWDDFRLEGASDPLTALAGRIAKRTPTAGDNARQAAATRLDFDRSEYVKRLSAAIRNELIPICRTDLPITLHQSEPGQPPSVVFNFAAQGNYQIECLLEIHWLEELHERSANISLQGRLVYGDQAPDFRNDARKLVQQVSINEGEPEMAVALSEDIAKIIGSALDLIDVQDGAPLVGGKTVQI
ncbi:protein kinase domain-containing protein [Cupriavidus respiraculi]|uniref:Protein kinase domain-containing protein n=1 Tax=Cupriavidus respiraculi TaxID=195930 RepID=A0ABM8WVS8_9BURK|nr:protein kinase [Cupriavidus respiraculi]CAG9171633.1 hypothetical protein LMG21510_01741 [Cupriavidus respiraculi]